MDGLRLSESGLELLCDLEGCRLHVYRDAAGLPTIGIGHLLTRSELSSGRIIIDGQTVYYHSGITRQQALDLLRQDLDPVEQEIGRSVCVPINRGQADCLIIWAFNIGVRAATNSTLMRRLNDGDYACVPGQLRRWVRSGGKAVAGLRNRRETEIRLWNGEEIKNARAE